MRFWIHTMPTKSRNTISLRGLFLVVLAFAVLGGAVVPAPAYAATIEESEPSDVYANGGSSWASAIDLGNANGPMGSGGGWLYKPQVSQTTVDNICFYFATEVPGSEVLGATLDVYNRGSGNFPTGGSNTYLGTSDPLDIEPNVVADTQASTDNSGAFSIHCFAFSSPVAWNANDGIVLHMNVATPDADVYMLMGGGAGNPTTLPLPSASTGNIGNTGAWYGQAVPVIFMDGPYVPPDFTDHIDTFTVSTSTNTVNITGYWNHTSASVFDSLVIQQSSQHLPLEYLPEFYSNGALVATTTGAFNLTFEYTPIPDFSGTGTSTLPISNNLRFTATLYHTDRDTYSCDSIFPIDTDGDGDPDYCDPRSTVVADTATAVLEDGRVGYTDITTSAGLASFPEYECGLTALSGCLKNAFLWLFYPAGDTVAQFRSLSLADRWPFAYAYQVGEIRNAVFDSPTTASTTLQVSTPMGDITFLSAAMMSSVPFAALIKTLLSAVMWFMAVMVIYRRILASHDTQTHV